MLTDFFTRKKLSTRITWAFILVLGVTLFGMERFLLKTMRQTQERRVKDFAINLAASMGLSIASDLVVGNIYKLDRFFLAMSQATMNDAEITGATLVNNENRIIVDFNPERSGELFDHGNFENWPPAQPIALLESNLVSAAVPVLSNISRVGSLVLTMRSRSFHDQLFYNAVFTIGFSLVLIGMSGLLLYMLIKDIVLHPITSLVNQANAVATTDIEQKITTDRKDEFSDLAGAIETMRKNIISRSEKYRRLVEESREIILSLNSNFIITSSNRAVFKMLGLSVEEVTGKSLFELAYIYPEDRGQTREFLQKKRIEFEQNYSVTFDLLLASALSSEPVEAIIRLEHIKADDHKEILAKIQLRAADALASGWQLERQRFVLENNLSYAGELTQKLTRNLTDVVSAEQITKIRLGVTEMLVNAMEHGNLEIISEQKAEQHMKGTYFEFFTERQRQAPFKNRRVRVNYMVDRHKILLKIEDEGPGFDVAAYTGNLGQNKVSHGRGIALARQIFDKVEYNARGNAVILTKKF